MMASRFQRARRQKRQIWSGVRCHEPACLPLMTPSTAVNQENASCHPGQACAGQGRAIKILYTDTQRGFPCRVQQQATACGAYVPAVP